MGQLIILAERPADRSRPARTDKPAFYFDLVCPFSYLMAERVERILGDVEWVPTASTFLDGQEWAQAPTMRREAERRAAALRLPLVWPDGFPALAAGALRTASYAAEIDAGARFALAASRLAFCGGFDLQDPDVLAEAAAAAAIPLEAALAAAGDRARDRTLQATARGLVRRGVRRLPAICVGALWFTGEHALGEAAALARARPAAPWGLAPVG